jgi:hypothetical protein
MQVPHKLGDICSPQLTEFLFFCFKVKGLLACSDFKWMQKTWVPLTQIWFTMVFKVWLFLIHNAGFSVLHNLSATVTLTYMKNFHLTWFHLTFFKTTFVVLVGNWAYMSYKTRTGKMSYVDSISRVISFNKQLLISLWSIFYVMYKSFVPVNFISASSEASIILHCMDLPVLYFIDICWVIL